MQEQLSNKPVVSKKKLLAPLSLRVNFSWTLAGNVVYAASQWGMVILLAKLGSIETVGQFALGFAITAPVFMLTNLELRAVQATDARREYSFSDYLGLRLISSTLALLIIGAIILISGYRGEIALVILAVGIAKALESISDIIYGLLQQRERMDFIARSMMLKGPLALVMLGVGVWLSGTALWGVIGMIGGWAAILFLFDLRLGVMMLTRTSHKDPSLKEAVPATLNFDTNLQVLRPLAMTALPLGFAMMLISLNTNIPRYFVEQYLGVDDLGIYAAIAYLMAIQATLISALGQTVIPRLAIYYADLDFKAFQRLLLRILVIGVLFGVVAMLGAMIAGREILTILYQPEYAEKVDIFILLMFATVIANVAYVLFYSMIATRYFKIQIPIFVFATISLIAICFWLIPEFGLRGAAYAQISELSLKAVGSFLVIIYAMWRLKHQA